MTGQPNTEYGLSVELADLGELGAPMGNPGQCLSVQPLDKDPNLLVKLYRPGQLTEEDEERIERLVDWPRSLPDPLGPGFLLRNSAWPLSRVTRSGSTAGVLMSLAPDRFYERVKDPYGSQRIVLTLDHVAGPAQDLKAIGLKPIDKAHRLQICAGVLGVAEFLERNGLVYGDWGYQNILWSRKDLSVYFIDMDACSFGEQRWVESFGFEDPLTPNPVRVDVATERYRCSILTAACLTGIKEPAAALAALREMAGQDSRLRELERVVRQNVDTADRGGRAPIADLCAALPAELAGFFFAGLTPTRSPSGDEPVNGSGSGPDADTGDNILRWDSVAPVIVVPVIPRQPTRPVKAAKPPVRTSASHRRSPAELRAAQLRAVVFLAVLGLVILFIVLANT
jgi:hypothetical protein